MKKTIYIISFTLLGILAQLLIHALLEMWYIELLIGDFARYGFGLSWNAWFLIHHIVTGVLFAGGSIGGYFSGRYWWRIIYTEKRYEKYRNTHQ
ncbi:MAG: hypothetical protein NUV61_04455 [Candidatus Azambacteria bacterium]|nr:hypothetical protein [Candidatus Azambacteria bacterium]